MKRKHETLITLNPPEKSCRLEKRPDILYIIYSIGQGVEKDGKRDHYDENQSNSEISELIHQYIQGLEKEEDEKRNIKEIMDSLKGLSWK